MNWIDVSFDWFLSATVRGSFLAIGVVLLQMALRGRLPAGWNHSLWFPVLLVLAAPFVPRTGFSLERQIGAAAEPVILLLPRPETGADSGEIPALRPTPVESSLSSPRLASIIWLSGVGLSLGVGLLAYRRSIQRLRKTEIRVTSELQSELATAACACGVRTLPQLMVAREVQSPAVTGFLRPLLVLPADFATTFDARERHLILLHELLHLKRGDLWINWFLFVLQSVHWCNPIVWLSFGRLRADREQACDGAVLAITGIDGRRAYGHALLKMESGTDRTAWSLCFVGMFQRGAALRSRIQAIASFRKSHPAWSIPGIGLIFMLCLAATRAQTESVPDGKQIRIEAKFIEVSGDAEISIPGERPELNAQEGNGLWIQDAVVAKSFMDGLSGRPEVDVLSGPTVITLSGTPAKIQVGQELPQEDEKTKFVGVALEILPVAVG